MCGFYFLRQNIYFLKGLHKKRCVKWTQTCAFSSLEKFRIKKNVQELDPTLWLHKTLQLVSKLVSSSAKNGGFVRLQWWPQFMQTAQSNGRGKHKPELKIKWYFSCWTFAEGLLQGRAFYSHGMEGEKKKKKENYTPTRHCQTLWVCVTALPGPGRFLCRLCMGSPFRGCPAAEQLWGLWVLSAEVSGAATPLLQSQVFVFISARINSLSRLFGDQDQVQLLGASEILHVFHKAAQLADFCFLRTFPPSLCLHGSLTPDHSLENTQREITQLY